MLFRIFLNKSIEGLFAKGKKRNFAAADFSHQDG